MRIDVSRLAFLHASRLTASRSARSALTDTLSNTAPLAAGLVGFAATSALALSPSTCDSAPSPSPRSKIIAKAMGSNSAPSSPQTGGVVDLTSITGYLNAEDSAALDAELMSTPGFSLEQLMELAGLAVAEAVYAVVPPSSADDAGDKAKTKILLVCGPGNNGGDGLVAARHLVLFGYDCTAVYPKRSKKQHFINLVKQMTDVGVKVLEEMPPDAKQGEYAAIVDAIFGFSFKGESGIREPFGSIIRDMVDSQGKGEGTFIISVDVPSGWNVDGGDLTGTGFMPDVLVSLTSPKLSSKKFTGRHFVGGRFLPPAIAEKYGVRMPPYKGVQQVMEITAEVLSKRTGDNEKEGSGQSWEEEYFQYLAEKDAAEASGVSNEDDNVDGKDSANTKGGEEEDWGVQYARYCADKEKRLDEEEERQKKREKRGN